MQQFGAKDRGLKFVEPAVHTDLFKVVAVLRASSLNLRDAARALRKRIALGSYTGALVRPCRSRGRSFDRNRPPTSTICQALSYQERAWRRTCLPSARASRVHGTILD